MRSAQFLRSGLSIAEHRAITKDDGRWDGGGGGGEGIWWTDDSAFVISRQQELIADSRVTAVREVCSSSPVAPWRDQADGRSLCDGAMEDTAVTTAANGCVSDGNKRLSSTVVCGSEVCVHCEGLAVRAFIARWAQPGTVEPPYNALQYIGIPL